MADTRIDELRRRLEREPGSRVFAQLAEELRKTGDLAEAIRVARAGLSLHAAYPSARLTLGRALLDSGEAASARVELEGALRDAPDNILASRFLAQAREALGDLEGAREQYRKTLVMAPGDRQLQEQLTAVEARLRAPAASVTGARDAETAPPAGRSAPPPLPPGATSIAEVSTTPTRGATGLAGPVAAAMAATPRAGAPPVVLATSRPLAPAEPEGTGESDELPATLRIRPSQDAAPPSPPARPPRPPEASAQAAAVASRDEPTPQAAAERPHERVQQPADAGSGGSTTPFSSSTLAELYFQQGLVERAKDVYRQLLEQDPGNDRARSRLDELGRTEPAADERAARRRSLERTIAGLETLLGAVRRR